MHTIHCCCNLGEISVEPYIPYKRAPSKINVLITDYTWLHTINLTPYMKDHVHSPGITLLITEPAICPWAISFCPSSSESSPPAAASSPSDPIVQLGKQKGNLAFVRF